MKHSSDSEIETDGLHSLISTPVLDGEHVYGICSYGELRALDARTGERVWESQDLIGERARWAAAFLVRNGDRYFINTDRGDLIIARLSNISREEMENILDQTGRLIAFTRQLDAVLYDQASVERYARKFLEGEYIL